MKNNYTGWLSLLGIIAMAILLVACSGSSPRGGESNGNTTIHVLAKDFSFSLEPSQTEARRITFVVKNNGSIQHDFAIRGKGAEHKTPMIEPGESATLMVNLEPGTYTYVCSLPGHEQLGMKGIFTVMQIEQGEGRYMSKNSSHKWMDRLDLSILH